VHRRQVHTQPAPPRHSGADSCAAVTLRAAGETIGGRMNWARTFTLLALAVVVGLFVATWFTIPSGRFEQKNLTSGYWLTPRIGYPARLFRAGLAEREEDFACARSASNSAFCLGAPRRLAVIRQVDLHTVRQRVLIAFGALAVVIILVGVAFGALRRKPSPPPAPSPADPSSA
jgi:hypothetical protein